MCIFIQFQLFVLYNHGRRPFVFFSGAPCVNALDVTGRDKAIAAQ